MAPSPAGRARRGTRPSIQAGEALRECRLLAAACALRARGHRGPEPRPGWGAGRAPRPSLPPTAACLRPPACTLPPALACRPLDRTGRTAPARGRPRTQDRTLKASAPACQPRASRRDPQRPCHCPPPLFGLHPAGLFQAPREKPGRHVRKVRQAGPATGKGSRLRARGTFWRTLSRGV